MLPIDNERLYTTLLELEVIDKKLLEAAMNAAKKSRQSISEVLLDRELISDENLGRVTADLLGVKFVRLSELSIKLDVLTILPEVVARQQMAIVYEKGKEEIKVAMLNPKNIEFLQFIAKKTGERVRACYASKRDIEQAFSLYKKDLQNSFDDLVKVQIDKVGHGHDIEAPITTIVDLLIEYAYSNRASDIHIEPDKKTATVRFRVDGVLHDVLVLEKPIQEQIVLRIKVMAKLRTDEKMAAQDGKAQVTLEQEELDIRVSVVPVVHGEKVVMRLLAAKARQFSLVDLGMSERDLKIVQAGFERPYGMVLSTGPTGSGKTTSIYAILKTINVREVNIATIEDPVEYDISGINQIQVNTQTGLTFASGLRAILRQDPNVIFVGEIRDAETADIAVNSAMTGHLVLSTLHTNDAATTLPRLLELGVEPFLVASTINVIVGQRLVRKICVKCRVSEEVTKEAFAHFSPDVVTKYVNKKVVRIYKGKGCEVCYGTGYQGRVGIFEVLKMTEDLRELVIAKSDFEAIKKRAQKEGMTTMMEDGVQKVLAGITTIEEISRATRE